MTEQPKEKKKATEYSLPQVDDSEIELELEFPVGVYTPPCSDIPTGYRLN